MSRESVLLGSLKKFYSEPHNYDVLHSILSKKEGSPSLRRLEWYATKYAKTHEILIDNHGLKVNLFIQYKSSLSGYTKKLFDPFCRSQRVDFMGMTTTVGQLNFIKWCINNDIIDKSMQIKEMPDPDLSPERSSSETIPSV